MTVSDEPCELPDFKPDEMDNIELIGRLEALAEDDEQPPKVHPKKHQCASYHREDENSAQLELSCRSAFSSQAQHNAGKYREFHH